MTIGLARRTDDLSVVAQVAAEDERVGMDEGPLDRPAVEERARAEGGPLSGARGRGAPARLPVERLRGDPIGQAEHGLAARLAVAEGGVRRAGLEVEPVPDPPGKPPLVEGPVPPPAVADGGFVQRGHRGKQGGADAVHQAGLSVGEHAAEAVGRLADHPSRCGRDDEIVGRQFLVRFTEELPERGGGHRGEERRADAEAVAARDLVVDGPGERMPDGVRVEVVVVEDDVTVREQLRSPGRPGEGRDLRFRRLLVPPVPGGLEPEEGELPQHHADIGMLRAHRPRFAVAVERLRAPGRKNGQERCESPGQDDRSATHLPRGLARTISTNLAPTIRSGSRAGTALLDAGRRSWPLREW